MLKTDTSSKEALRELINHVLHESHLEGFDATPSFVTLLDNFIEGKISLDAVQSIILKESNKFAMEKKVNKKEIVFSKTMDYEIARSTLIGLSATLY
ncbi:MAG: antitoxin VbhA family protein, partial [bacterium]